MLGLIDLLFLEEEQLYSMIVIVELILVYA